MNQSSGLPFVTKSAVIEKLARLVDPSTNPIARSAVLKIIQDHPALSRRFFAQSPSPVWARILLDAGLLFRPPSPVPTKQGLLLPTWEAQEYLVNVASHVPEVVLEHIRKLDCEPHYKARSLRALAELQPADIESVLEVVCSWFTDYQSAQVLSWQAVPLMDTLRAKKAPNLAIPLLEKLTQPWLRDEIAGADQHVRSALGPDLPSWLLQVDSERAMFEKLAGAEPIAVAEVIERNLREAIKLATHSQGAAKRYLESGWRRTIDKMPDDEREHRTDSRDQLLDALMDALLMAQIQNSEAVEDVLDRFLKDPILVFKRLALHLLSRWTSHYPALVAREIAKADNFHEDLIHHEFVALVTSGFSGLDQSARQEFVSRIRGGPSEDDLASLVKFAPEDVQGNLDAFKAVYIRRWIRDWFWPIKESLSPDDRSFLDALVEAEGIPEPVVRQHDFVEVSWVRDTSPVSKMNIAEMDPGDLVAFLRDWQPPQRQSGSEERQTYRGLAGEFTAAFSDAPDRYAAHLVEILRMGPDYAVTLFGHYSYGQQAGAVPWTVLIPVVKELLPSTYSTPQNAARGESAWVEARRATARLLLRGLYPGERQIPSVLWPDVRAVLLSLADDVDPNPEVEEEWPGIDPLTASINHVRPLVLETLIRLVSLGVPDTPAQAGTSVSNPPLTRVLDPEVARILERHLDPNIDRSLAVCAVMGNFLPQLAWLDTEWAHAHLDAIFPAPTTEEATRRFKAAFGTFVTTNGYILSLAPVLSAAYRSAVGLVRDANAWDQQHLDPAARLVKHVIWMHLLTDELPSGGLGEELIDALCGSVNPTIVVDVARAIVSAAEDKSVLGKTWPRIRRHVERRVAASTLASFPPSFDEEMWELAPVFIRTPDQEDIGKLMPLLQVVALHVARSDYLNQGWEGLIQYVEAKSKTHPVEAMQVLQRMIGANENRHWYDYEKRTRRLLERCGANDKARPLVCAVIDLLESRGITEYHDLLERICL